MQSSLSTRFAASNKFFASWGILSLLSILHILFFDGYILKSPPVLQVQYIPDDAYYYLQLAKNFNGFGYWTFDSGFSMTSGFHLLQAYALAGIYWLFEPDSDRFVRLGLAWSSLLTVLLAVSVWFRGIQSKNLYLLTILAFATTTPNFLFNSISITEWPLAISLAIGYYFVFHSLLQSRRSPFPLMFIGFFLSLARSDSGLLPFSFFLASLLQHRRTGGRHTVITSSVGLIGAALGVLAMAAHNYIFTGEILQSSARIKAHWSQFQGQLFYSSFSVLASIFGLDFGPAAFQRSIYLLGLAILLGPALLLILGLKSRDEKIPLQIFRLNDESGHDILCALGAFLCLSGYLLFYTFNSGLQNWYTANLILPAVVLYVAAGQYLEKRILPKKNFIILWFSSAALLTIGLNLYSLYPLDELHSPWPHQQAYHTAGLYLRQNPPGGRIGAWNAGITGYYQGGQVINLDGLVNNDIGKYIISNSLPDYLREKNIQYLIDFENMFHPPFTWRGGYQDVSFYGNLEIIREFDHGQYPEWKFLRLYKLKE